MNNFILGLLSILLCFGLEIIIERVYKKEGLFIWISVASILANILVCKTINIFGFTASLGNVLFASNFLATDIISEKYGLKESKKAVNLGLLSVIGFLISTQIGLLFIPDSSDVAQTSMITLFSLSLRTSIASVTMYYISNLVSIYIFNRLKDTKLNKLWVRNNIATIISNCGENFLFAFGAFYKIYDIRIIISIAITGSIIETFIALCDTPFLYLAKIKNKKEN